MNITARDGKIIFSDNEGTYSFDAHAEAARPSFMPTISVGGKHLSSRDPDIKIERHTAVQDAAVGNGMGAWYTQEFLPDGVDYKLSKKAAIYLVNFASGEEKTIYRGECYGDLTFCEDDLFFNVGNKVAVYHISTGETEILFKHSGIKKSKLELHITPKHIFFQHWKHSGNNTMWYDRETKEVINPHFDGRPMFFLDDETIIFHGVSHTWRYDVANMKKKRFFSPKEQNKIVGMAADFFDIPKEHYLRYYAWSELRLKSYENERFCFECTLSHHIDGEDRFKAEQLRHKLGLPSLAFVLIFCDCNGRDIRIEADKADIRRSESHEIYGFPHVSLNALPQKKQD